MPDDRLFHRALKNRHADRLTRRGSWFAFDVVPDAAWHRWPMPKCPGVYAIYRDGRLVYIGSSVNLRARMSNHINGPMWRGCAATVKFSPMGANWVTRERRLIERLRPSENRQWNRSFTNARHEGLRRLARRVGL